MDNQDNKSQTKFPQKQIKLNQAEVENDYLIDNIPYDFTSLMSSKGNPDINKAYDEFKKKQFIFMKLNVYLKIMKIIV